MNIRRLGRRQFLALAGAGALAGAAGWRTRASAQDSVATVATPDLIVVNANIYTVDPRSSHAEAFAVQAGRFQAVGSNEAIRNLARRTTQIFDAQKMTIVPGFIDCHNHAGGNILLYEVLVGNPFMVEFVTIASIIEKLRAKAQATPPGFWVDGYFFDDTKVKDNRQLNVHDLDQVSKDHPVVGASSRWPYLVLQQQGPRARQHQPRDAKSSGRNL